MLIKDVNEMGSRTPLSPHKRMLVFERDDFTCQYCGRSAPEVALEVDHILPVSKKGKNDLRNLVTICRECNLGKGDRYTEVMEKHLVRREIQEHDDEFKFTVTFCEDEYAILRRICRFVAHHSEKKHMTVGELVHQLIIKNLSEIDDVIDMVDGVEYE